MSDGMVTLRFGGGGSLTFRDATHRFRTVARDEPFETDASTAAALLQDPAVTAWQGGPRLLPDLVATDAGEAVDSVVAAPGSLEDRTVADLRELAKSLELELPARARKADLIAAIEAAEAETDEDPVDDEGDQPQREMEAASSEPEDVPDEDAFERPAGERSVGTISLGDLPPGARIGVEQT